MNVRVGAYAHERPEGLGGTITHGSSTVAEFVNQQCNQWFGQSLGQRARGNSLECARKELQTRVCIVIRQTC